MEKEVDFVIFPLVQKNPDNKEIDRNKIIEYTKNTLEEYPPEDRALAWLVLLRLYPSDPNKWEEEKKTLIDGYWVFVKEFGVEHWYDVDLPDNVTPKEMNVPNKPLMGQIHSDIVRTGRQIMFFPPELERQGKDPNNSMSQFEGYMRRIERILYIFGSINVGLSYTQGFNELVSPLYYVMLKATALFRNNQDDIEALSFAMLQQLITSTPIHEMYTTQDKSSIILHKLDDFTRLMTKHLPKVAAAINYHKLHPASYCYRWFNLLFAQEYDMPSLLPVWDVLFSHIDELLDFAFYIGIAQLKVIEDQIRADDLSLTLVALQNLDIPDVFPVIKYAVQFYEADHKKVSLFKKLFH